MTAKRYPLLVFDWDGTLMNSISHIIDSLQYAMRETGETVLDRQQSGDIIGLGLREAIEALFPHRVHDEEFIQAYSNSYRDYYLDPIHMTELFDGALETLHTLRERGHMLAIATGKGRQGLNHVLQQTGLNKLFSASRCADETRSKPHPEMLETILQDVSLSPDNALMIGDTEFDLEMASNAGVASVGASYGVHDETRLLKHSPKAVIEDISHLPQTLTRLLS